MINILYAFRTSPPQLCIITSILYNMYRRLKGRLYVCLYQERLIIWPGQGKNLLKTESQSDIPANLILEETISTVRKSQTVEAF